MTEQIRHRALPTDAEGLSVDLLNEIIREQVPEAAVTAFRVLESHVFGSGVASTAGRIVIEADYSRASPAGLPRRIVVKVARTDDDVVGRGGEEHRCWPLYANEVSLYTRLQPGSFLEAPRCLGGAYDPKTASFLLLLEDLRERGASFPNVTVTISLAQIRALLDVLATLHARYWNSPALTSTLGWMETHLRGRIHDRFNAPDLLPREIALLVEAEQFKREMVQRLGTTANGLFQGFQLVQKHQGRLPQTVVHGDTHLGNTYMLPGDKAGLVDWQLSSQGYAMHDISYILATSLSVEMRRTHERALLAYYREQLVARGVKAAPSPDEIWLEYRRAVVWAVYIGWLTTPVENYGWQICVMNHLRVMTAYEDLETGKLIDAMR